MKQYIKTLWYLLNGYDSSVKNKESTIQLHVFDENIRTVTIDKFLNLQQSEAAKSKILLLDHVMSHFRHSVQDFLRTEHSV
jgi:hypothetical protein